MKHSGQYKRNNAKEGTKGLTRVTYIPLRAFTEPREETRFRCITRTHCRLLEIRIELELVLSGDIKVATTDEVGGFFKRFVFRDTKCTEIRHAAEICFLATCVQLWFIGLGEVLSTGMWAKAVQVSMKE